MNNRRRMIIIWNSFLRWMDFIFETAKNPSAYSTTASKNAEEDDDTKQHSTYDHSNSPPR